MNQGDGLTVQKALVLGGTGLVGSFLLETLAQEPDIETTALVRKAGALNNKSDTIRELVFDFENQENYKLLSNSSFDFVFCCLGTTRKKAGSAEQFRRVDFEYPARILEAVQSSAPVFALVSSVGADSPAGLYLKTKFDIEQKVFQSGLNYVVVRPSLLLGERKEFRLAESLSIKIFSSAENLIRNQLGVKMARYAPIHARDVAYALLNAARMCKKEKKNLVLEGKDLYECAKNTLQQL